MKRALTPTTNPTGLGSAAAAIYAAVQMIVNLTSHKSGYGFDPQVIVAAAAAGWLFYTRFKVTPVADPKDGNGNPMVAAAPVATVITMPAGTGGGGATGGAVYSPPPPPPGKTLLPPAAPE